MNDIVDCKSMDLQSEMYTLKNKILVLIDYHGGRTRAGIAHCNNTCP